MLRDAFGPIRAKEIEAELAELVDNVQVIGYKEVKPWGEFISSMKPPAHWDAKTIEQRVSTNMLYYRSNYLVICGVILALRILFAPFIIMSLILVAALFGYVRVFSKGPITIGELRLDETKQMQITIATSLIFLGLVGTLQALFWVILLCICVCSAHMLFRARSISSKLNRTQEEVKLSMHRHMAASGSGSGSVDSAALLGEDDGDNSSLKDFLSSATHMFSSIANTASTAAVNVSASATATAGGSGGSTTTESDDVENAASKRRSGGSDDEVSATPYRPGSSSTNSAVVGGVAGAATSARKRASPTTGVSSAAAPSSSSGSALYTAGGARAPHNPKND